MSDKPELPLFGVDEPVTIVFPVLFEARKFKRNGKEIGDAKFSASFLFPKDHPDVKLLRKVAITAAKEKWPDCDPKELKFPFKNGDAEAKRAEKKGKDGSFYEGHVILKTSSKFAPDVLDGNDCDKNGDPRHLTDEKAIYSGALVAGEVNFVAYEGDEKDGVTAYLNTVVLLGDGDRIAGTNRAQRFRGIKGQSSAEDPTEGLDDIDDIDLGDDD